MCTLEMSASISIKALGRLDWFTVSLELFENEKTPVYFQLKSVARSTVIEACGPYFS